MAKNTELKKEILKATDGVFGTLTDFILGYSFFMFEMGGCRGYGQICRAIERTYSDLEVLNYRKIRRAVRYLRRRGLLEFVKDEAIIRPLVTKKGVKRLGEVFPVYEEERPWDKKAYFIFYDVPEKYRRARDVFRSFLEKLRCGQVQASVWAIFYNPIGLLSKFQGEKRIPGSIIVSCLGQGGYISGETLEEFAARIFRLEKLNARYKEFVEKYKGLKKVENKFKLAFDFYSVLTDDPQIPFELLPDDWSGDKAYRIFKRLSDSKSLAELLTKPITKPA